MTKEKLKQYISCKKEIALLEKKIEELRDKGLDIPTVMGKVTGSSKNFPYTPVRYSVEVGEPRRTHTLNKLIRAKEERIEIAERIVLEIEQFIHAIDDAELRSIFELVFQDGKRHEEVANEMGLERSSITKKINGYLKLSHNSHK